MSRTKRRKASARTYRANLAIRRRLMDRLWDATDDDQRDAIRRAIRTVEAL
jgi:hypothetical protein